MAYDPPHPYPLAAADLPRDAGGEPVADADRLDQQLRGRIAVLLGGQSPWAALQAWEDWAYHLAISPVRQIDLWRSGAEAMFSIASSAPRGATREDWAFKPTPADRRFRHPGWDSPPFNFFAQGQLALEELWRRATNGVHGVDVHHERRVGFLGGFVLNALAPVNFAWTNPEVVEAVERTGGLNFLAGTALLLEDVARLSRGEKLDGLEDFKPGVTMALTPGSVIYRNELMELIQYAPTTPNVHREPILIVPAWIMKYYILDLTPPNSLVRYLVEQGFTVFIISWKNPGPELRDTSFEDYRRKGVMAALEVIERIIPDEKVHAVGYCLGGTVLSIATAAMDREGEARLASMTLLAAQTDFEESGELMMFIDESQLAVLEDMMNVQGYLEARQMSGAFYALRANEMVFAKLVQRYLLGEPVPPGDIDAWLTDPTRMPARMHSEYLRQLFLNNTFARGGYMVDGRAVALKDIRTPTFALGAERDHIAPWRSVYKIELYGSANTTFVLTGGGHNTSVVSPPGKAGAYYKVSQRDACATYVDPDAWLASTAKLAGSWWPEWVRWLELRSSPDRVAPPPMGRPEEGLHVLAAAPGVYVLEA
jgi:polyhydroxyalkanoate synthase